MKEQHVVTDCLVSDLKYATMMQLHKKYEVKLKHSMLTGTSIVDKALQSFDFWFFCWTDSILLYMKSILSEIVERKVNYLAMFTRIQI